MTLPIIGAAYFSCSVVTSGSPLGPTTFIELPDDTCTLPEASALAVKGGKSLSGSSACTCTTGSGSGSLGGNTGLVTDLDEVKACILLFACLSASSDELNL